MALALGREKHRVNICLNNGVSIQVICTKSTRVSELAAKAWAQVDPSRELLEIPTSHYFALRLESVCSEQKLHYWLGGDLSVTEVENRYMHCPGIQVSAWRYRLRIRYYPADFRDLVETNEVFANYFFSQLCEDIQHAAGVAADTALKLGALQARRILADQCTGAIHKRNRPENLIREVGLHMFCPKSIFSEMKQKNIKKSLLQTMKTYDGLCQEECVLNYIGVCYQEQCVVTEKFTCVHDGRASILSVCPTRGLVIPCDGEWGCPPIPFSNIKRVSVVVTPKGKVTADITCKEGSKQELELSSLSDLYDLVTLLEGFCKCSNTSISLSPLYHQAKFPISEEVAVRVGAELGLCSGAYAPCDSKKELSSCKEYWVFTAEDDYAISEQELQDRSVLVNQPNRQNGKGPCSSLKQRIPRRAFSRRSTPSVESISYVCTVGTGEDEMDLSMVNGAEKVPSISHNDLTTGNVLGEGRFGEVRVGELNGVPIAVKTCKKDTPALEKQKFILEAVIMHEFDHPHIIRMLGVAPSEPCAIVMEFAPLGEIRSYLMTMTPPFKTLLMYCTQLSSATAYLESLGFVHRDLAARNVLVCNPDLVKLSDFGLSRWIADDLYYKASSGVLPVKWMAPESINFRRFTTASDVWMFAVCIWEILSCGAKPFMGIRNVDVLCRLEDGERLPQPESCTDDLYLLLIRCWSFESSERPTFAVVRDEIGTMFRAEGGCDLTFTIRDLDAKNDRSMMKMRLSMASEQLLASMETRSRAASTGTPEWRPVSTSNSSRPCIAHISSDSVEGSPQQRARALTEIDHRPPACLPPGR